MKKKKKKTSKRQPKIDVALESLLNLERVSKKVLKKLATLEQNIYPLLNDQHPNQPKPNGYWNAVENGLQ
jgi:hypothetical protein